jgi:hypothetical protein
MPAKAVRIAAVIIACILFGGVMAVLALAVAKA